VACLNAQEPSARRIEVDQATRSHFDDAYHSKTLRCGTVRLREDWLDMDCVARESEQIVSARILAKGMFETPAAGGNR
jgi:hypothetical protein